MDVLDEVGAFLSINTKFTWINGLAVCRVGLSVAKATSVSNALLDQLCQTYT